MFMHDASRCVVFTSYRQMSDICIQAHLFNHSHRLHNYAIVLHNNNDYATDDLLRHARAFPNRRMTLLWTRINAGFAMGPVQALDHVLGTLQQQGCRCALHLHPDVFVMEEARLMQQMDSFCSSENSHVWRLAQAFGKYIWEPAFDAFMFKPHALPWNAFHRWVEPPPHAQNRPEWMLMQIAREHHHLGPNATTLREQWAVRYFHGAQGPLLAEWNKVLEDTGGRFEPGLLKPDLWGLAHAQTLQLPGCPAPAPWMGAKASPQRKASVPVHPTGARVQSRRTR